MERKREKKTKKKCVWFSRKCPREDGKEEEETALEKKTTTSSLNFSFSFDSSLSRRRRRKRALSSSFLAVVPRIAAMHARCMAAPQGAAGE